MASALIHIAVAKEVNKKLLMEEEPLLIGSIAPDLAKIVGETKHKGHFLTSNKDIPDMEMFREKYDINSPYEMGYFIHLYTDKIWFRDFLPKYYNKTQLRLRTGEFVELPFEEKLKLIYSDYSSLNVMLKREYSLDLDFITNEYNTIETPIEEIDSKKLYLLLNEVDKILLNSKENELNVFTEEEIKDFINICIEEIIKEVKDETLAVSK